MSAAACLYMYWSRGNRVETVTAHNGSNEPKTAITMQTWYIHVLYIKIGVFGDVESIYDVKNVIKALINE